MRDYHLWFNAQFMSSLFESVMNSKESLLRATVRLSYVLDGFEMPASPEDKRRKVKHLSSTD